MVGLVPGLKKSYYKKKFHKLHKEINGELRKAPHEKIDSRLDDLLDDYKLLLEHFSEEIKGS